MTLEGMMRAWSFVSPQQPLGYVVDSLTSDTFDDVVNCKLNKQRSFIRGIISTRWLLSFEAISKHNIDF